MGMFQLQRLEMDTAKFVSVVYTPKHCHKRIRRIQDITSVRKKLVGMKQNSSKLPRIPTNRQHIPSLPPEKNCSCSRGVEERSKERKRIGRKKFTHQLSRSTGVLWGEGGGG